MKNTFPNIQRKQLSAGAYSSARAAPAINEPAVSRAKKRDHAFFWGDCDFSIDLLFSWGSNISHLGTAADNFQKPPLNGFQASPFF